MSLFLKLAESVVVRTLRLHDLRHLYA